MHKLLPILTLALLPALMLTPTATAQEKKPVAAVSTKDGLAVKGYDVVAYFDKNSAVKGDAQFSTEWNGAKWHFASAANRDKFVANPGKYAPQYGGYCAWAVGHGYTAPSDPEAFTIHEGKLYLNYNKDVSAKWSPDKANWIAKGDEHWPKLHKAETMH